ncbi:MAG: glycerate dehydrogenase [Cyanobacteria bacterium RYN_339]|nr:glycerate dehydrogenase [Cyanobacteria bacterium RYN_339]
MQRVVFLDRCTLRADVRRPAFAHTWDEHWTTAPEQVLPRLREATIAITNKVPLRADTLEQLPGLKLVAVAATGVDGVDWAWCHANGVTVCNIRGYAVRAVPEHVLMLALALRRQLPAFQQDLRAGAWQRAEAFCLLDRPIRDLGGATLGIVGAGELGQAVATLGRAFGMEVLFAERRGAAPREGRVAFDELLARADVLSLHCPLTPETRGMIGATELARMKPDAVLINTARGALVDADALIAALALGHLGGAGIDVLPEEPPRQGHPLLETDLPNLIITPHVAWASTSAMQALADQLIDNLEAFSAGVPRNVI